MHFKIAWSKILLKDSIQILLNQKYLNLHGPQLSPRSHYSGIHEETNFECVATSGMHICIFSRSLPMFLPFIPKPQLNNYSLEVTKLAYHGRLLIGNSPSLLVSGNYLSLPFFLIFSFGQTYLDKVTLPFVTTEGFRTRHMTQTCPMGYFPEHL